MAPRALNPHAFAVAHPTLGDFECYLDMAAPHPPDDTPAESLDAKMREAVGHAAQMVVPVEIVTPPLLPEDMPALAPLLSALTAGGARGTSDSLFYAHGLHLNVEVPAVSAPAIAPVLRAFVLLEDWLRDRLAIDLTRRAFNFVNPFPRRFVDIVAQEGWAPADMPALTAAYLSENPTRDRSLDLTPVLAMHDRPRIEAALEGAKLKPRPTFHYRLPDCAIGIPGWTPARDWNLWVQLERIAAAADTVERLAAAWRRYRADWLTLRGDWLRRSAEILETDGLLPPKSPT